MTINTDFHLKLTAIKVSQPLGEFFITTIKACDLVKIAFSEELEYYEDGKLHGSQRKKDEKRLLEISRYIDSVEMSFPNSIILAANYTKDGEVENSDDYRWKILKKDDANYEIIIPSDKPLAAIIDGQHRLFAFQYVSKEERKNMDLVCSVFFDLPNSYQAFLFATINGNQKKVEKSLALEQFGFNVQDEPQESWTPEKLSIYFSRRLNFEKESPLHHKIKITPKFEGEKDENWIITTATLAEGIMTLFSTNPKKDRVEMGQVNIWKGRSRDLVKNYRDSSPLRQLYISNNDSEIFDIIYKYFKSVTTILWSTYNPNSYIMKTVGVQALFDLLKKILLENVNERSFDKYLEKLKNIDFSNSYFQASGIGRSRIKRLLLFVNSFEIDLTEEEKIIFEQLISNRVN